MFVASATQKQMFFCSICADYGERNAQTQSKQIQAENLASF
jgi:hypothetical protein